MSSTAQSWEVPPENLDAPNRVTSIQARNKVGARAGSNSDIEMVLTTLESHRLNVTRYFKAVIESAQIPDFVMDDFAQDILFQIWKSDSRFDWQKCTLDDLLRVGSSMIVDRLIPRLQLNFSPYFEGDRRGKEMLDLLIAKTREAFGRLELDPYLDADWEAILHREAEQIFKHDFPFYSLRRDKITSTQVSDGKVSKTKILEPQLEKQDGNEETNSTLKIEQILLAFQTNQINQDFRWCIHQQLVSFHQKFPDIWSVISLRIWEPISTKAAASQLGMKEGAFRERSSSRLQGLLNHLRVCVPLLKESEYE